ncbi:MAG: hypothetical protein Q4G00_14205 [Clostridia bacterium]|nr:hypothetical protein [Clostridia bacterium]
MPFTEITTENNQYPPLTSSRKGIFLQTEYFNRQVASEDNTGYNIVPYGYFTYRHMSDDLTFSFNINEIVDYGIVSTLYPVFTTTSGLDSHFLRAYLNNSLRFASYCVLQKQGGSRTYMYFKKLASHEAVFPCVAEQKRIALFTDLLDRRICAQQKTIDALKKYKRGLVSLVFSVENPYALLLSETPMTELLVEYRNRDTAGLRVCSVAVNKGVVDQIEHLGRSFSAADTSNYGRVKPGDIVYTKSPTGDFPYGIVKQNWLDEEVAVSPLYGVYTPISFEVGFLLHIYFEQHSNANKYIRTLAQKGAKNTINISTSHFLDKSILFPKDPAEIKLLVRLFSGLTERIAATERHLDLLTQKRRTLLQQLFI